MGTVITILAIVVISIVAVIFFKKRLNSTSDPILDESHQETVSSEVQEPVPSTDSGSGFFANLREWNWKLIIFAGVAIVLGILAVNYFLLTPEKKPYKFVKSFQTQYDTTGKYLDTLNTSYTYITNSDTLKQIEDSALVVKEVPMKDTTLIGKYGYLVTTKFKLMPGPGQIAKKQQQTSDPNKTEVDKGNKDNNNQAVNNPKEGAGTGSWLKIKPFKVRPLTVRTFQISDPWATSDSTNN